MHFNKIQECRGKVRSFFTIYPSVINRRKKLDTESIDEPGKIVYDLPYQFSPVQGGTVRKNNIS